MAKKQGREMGKAVNGVVCAAGDSGSQRAVRAGFGRWLLVLAGLFAVLAGHALGQAQGTGTVLGSVTDPKGDAVTGATVTIAEPSKGVSRTATTSKTGEFLIPDLPVGTYILTISTEGFETYVSDGVLVDADKSVKIVAKMVVGSQKEVLNVVAEGTTVDTNSATLATLIDQKLVEDLPIDGRNVVGLAGILPGVTDLNAPPTNTSDRGGSTFAVSGSRNTQNLFLFDGLMWNNLFFNTGINFPPPNALQEIAVQLNNFKAQYGRNAGAVFNVVTKSGSNTHHGAVWDYLQNQIFNASDYLTKRNPKDISNQFGFTATGPVIKDKLYYAVTFQDLIQKLQAIGTANTLGNAERGFAADGVTQRPCTPGVYAAGTTCASFAADVIQPDGSYNKLLNPTQYVGTSGLQWQPSNGIAMLNNASVQAGGPAVSPCLNYLNQAAIYASAVPYFPGSTGTKIQGTYLPYAEIPTPCLNPVIAALNKKYVQVPNTNVQGAATLVSIAPQPKQDINLLARVDYHLNDKHTIDARYDLIDANDSTAPGVNSRSQGISTYEVSSNAAVSNFGNIGDTWVITGNLVNVARAGYKRYTYSNPPTDHTTWADLGGNFIEPGVPVLPTISISNAYTLGSTDQANASTVNENIELLEQLSWQKGNHNLQFGVNFLRLQYLNVTDYPGKLSFNTTATGLGVGDAAFGLLTSVQANSRLVQGGVSHSVFSYIQDDWRATAKLNLNLGIRYELPFQWYQPNGYASTFIPGFQSTRFPGAVGGLAFPGDPGVLRSLVPTDFNGVAPRFGGTYDVFGTGKFVLRGGFGMFFDAINANVIGVGEPFYFQLYRTLPDGGASIPLKDDNLGIYKVPTGFDPKNPQFLPPYTLFYPDRNFRTPYYMSFNLGFQFHVPHGGVLDTNYVGKLGRKLTIPYDQNPAITDCSGGYYQANQARYANVDCPITTPGSNPGQASSSQLSYSERVRYTPFNYGGTGLVDFDSIGTSSYNGFQTQYTQRGGKKLTILASYTYSKFIDLQTQSQTTSNTIPNVYNLASERGPSDYDYRHVFNMGWVLTLPKVTEGPNWVQATLNNWIFSGKFSGRTGKPFSVLINNDSALNGEPNQRATLLPGVNPLLPSNRHRADKVTAWFNPYAFTYPLLGTFSNQRRNSFRGPGYLDTDLTLGREFPLENIRSGMKAQFRAEAFNVWNTPNLNQPGNTFSCNNTGIQTYGDSQGRFGKTCIDSGGALGTVPGTSLIALGRITSTYGNNGNTSTNGRKMQFSLTIYY